MTPRLNEFHRNAAKLVALEQERVGLDSLRRVTFTTRFLTRAFAEHFVATLDLKHWRVHVDHHPLSQCEWYVRATKCMEPTAENVTKWEDYFSNHPVTANNYFDGGGLFHGWEYCDKRDVSFSPNEYFDVETFASARADVLFGVGLAQDRLDGHRWNTWPAVHAPAFKLQPAQFVRHARAHRPADPQPTASGFSQWLYSLYANSHGSDEDREYGREAEQAILDARRRAYGSFDCDVVHREFPQWALVHNGLHLRGDQISDYFEIAALPIAGRPLRASPDLVFRNGLSGEVLIVEIKHSRMPIPKNLWPNIWGQLWCYAQIDIARAAPKVTAVGEVWGDGWARKRGRLVCLRASVRRDPRAREYDRFFRVLFDIYRGED